VTDDRSNDNYHISSRLLARKGGAAPLQARGRGLVLSRDVAAGSLDGEDLSEAIVAATLDLLSPDAKPRKPPKAAALTDLFDPALADGNRAKR
jgi:hypothetical protein